MQNLSSESEDENLDGIYDHARPTRQETSHSGRRNRKRKHLEPRAPFCISSSLALIPLDSDLITEPYTDRCHLPQSLLSTRPFFIFTTSGRQIIAGTRDVLITYDSYSSLRKGREMRSYVSIVDVYDRYGLEMAYSYMHHLYHSQISLRNPHWLAVYIIGSIALISADMAISLREMRRHHGDDPLFISHLCSVLLIELVLLDSREPKLSIPLQTHTTTLPLDILARIFNSKLISKDIAECVTKQRSCRDLRLGESELRAMCDTRQYVR